MAGALVLGSLAAIAMNTAIVLPALALGRAIDAVLAIERGEGDPTAAGWAALAVVGATAAVEVPRIFKRWWLMTGNARIRMNLRADALRGVLAWPAERLHRTPIGDLLARIDGDIEALGIGIREATTEIWDTVLFSVSLIVAMLSFDPYLTLLALSPVPVAMLLALLSGRWVSERTTTARVAAAIATSALQELLAGVRVLRLFGRAATAIERYAALSLRQSNAVLATTRLRSTLQPTYTGLMTVGIVVLLWQGGERVVAGLLTAGQLVAFLELYLRFVNRGFRVPQLVNSVQSGGAAYRRLRPLLAPALTVEGEVPWASFRANYVAGAPAPTPPAPLSRKQERRETITPPLHRNGEGAGPPRGRDEGARGAVHVQVQDLVFRYPGAARPALQGLSLDIPAGAFVAITGPVGAGKSALAKALAGLYPLEAGQVRLDGQLLDQLTATERAARIGYLPQEPWLFSGTVRENVVFGASELAGPEADVLIAEAIRLAQLEPDLHGFAAGLETPIGEGGVRVSGGQRQRIALARALLAGAPARPGLLILDDPFSAVDVETETRLADGLLAAVGMQAPPAARSTIVLCSHRLAAFPRAQLVILLDDGRIVERGSHAELMAADGRYARIFHAQQRAGTALPR